MKELQQNWEEIKELCKKEYDILEVPFKTWILPLQIYSIENNVIKIMVPTELSQGAGVSYISNKYKLPLKVTIAEVMNQEYELDFISEKDAENDSKKTVSTYNNNSYTKVRTEEANLNSKYTFNTFVVGSNNRFAHSASLAVAESPGEVYNPLFLYGGPGLGKTHLMHSIGHYIIEQSPNMNILYVTSETFTNEVIESIRAGNQAMTKFREKYRTIDVLLLDDVQFIIGKESTQEEFFHTFNELHSSKKAIILSSDKPPKDMETLEERLRSRFEWGLIADIQPPNYETRMAILRKNAETIGCNINDEIIQYIATNIKSNIRELEGAFNKVIALSNMNRDQEITIATAEEAMRDIISPNKQRKITPDFIIEVVSNHFNITPADIISKKRNQDIVVPRQIVMYLCREMADTPLTAIGKMLGNRDHTTIIHGVNKITDELDKDENLSKTVDNIKKLLNPS
ncbi:chromosomal replication initiator protein DnaA [bacterium C-53]|nr:chromosomal replication initiator protein DnaA [Lachnospiraceae bacterium]NBI03111.1 chromosomal replication initiator protein DnaA [Lachnospiraceae bacterium]RKJ10717.1 chromosomal replication initiator protein DnaA [bacterium C-53]